MTLLALTLNNLNSNPNEIAYTFAFDAAGNLVYKPFTGTPGAVGIGLLWNPGNKSYMDMDGYIHTHKTGDYPIFSISDLSAISGLIGHINDPSIFTAQVWTSTGVYALTIANLTQFAQFSAKLSINHTQWENDYVNQYYITPTASANDAAEGLAQMLADKNSGLTLSRLNIPVGTLGNVAGSLKGLNWSTLSYSGGSLQATLCP